MTSYKGMFNMITLTNATGRSLFMSKELVIHNFPMFKENMVEVTLATMKDAFKSMNATVILVKDYMVAAKAHIDNPAADIYVLEKNKFCVTCAFKGTNGIKEDNLETEVFLLCPSEMITWK